MLNMNFSFGYDCETNKQKCGSGVHSYCVSKDTPCYVNDIKFTPIGTFDISAKDRISLDGVNELVFLRNGTNLPITQVVVNNAAPCYSLGNFESGNKFYQIADEM